MVGAADCDTLPSDMNDTVTPPTDPGMIDDELDYQLVSYYDNGAIHTLVGSGCSAFGHSNI